MFRTASGPSADTGQETALPSRRGRLEKLVDVLALLMAGGSLALGLYGSFALFAISQKHRTAQIPEVSSQGLTAGKAVPRMPRPEPLVEQPNLLTPEPELAPILGGRALRRYHRPFGRRSKLGPRSRVPKSPSPAELRMEAIADELAAVQTKLETMPGQVMAMNKPLMDSLTGQIAAFNAEQRAIGSRVAVTEDGIRQLRERSWFDWCTKGATVLAAAASLLTALRAPLRWLRRRKRTPVAP